MVRVSDSFLGIENQAGQTKGLLRVIMYLEDFGVAVSKPGGSGQPPASVTAMRTTGQVSGGGDPSPGSPEYQIVWELEMWKRAEMAKFKAHLKQVEQQTIEKVTNDWRQQEGIREQKFEDAIKQINAVESKLRHKSTDLQRREEKIMQLEDELRQKIIEVSRQLTSKEEEIIAIKRKFKEERVQLDSDKKRMQKELSEY